MVTRRAYFTRFFFLILCLATLAPTPVPGLQEASPLPAGKLVFGTFVGELSADRRFQFQGQDWPRMAGTWETRGNQLILTLEGASQSCVEPGRYTFRATSTSLQLTLISDSCIPRRMALDGSQWRPQGTPLLLPDRTLTRQLAKAAPALPAASPPAGSWPSFRGPAANGVAEGQDIPSQWDVTSGENVLWQTPIPGLAHSSPIVWGDLIFVTSAISGRGAATFRPGLYGDGDASDDRTEQRWMIYAVDKMSGAIRWERTAFQGIPREKRHIKSTYASSTPATDGRTVVAFFGSQGVYAYDVEGNFRWKVKIGHLNLGAYNIPTIEWGTASSPIIWNGMVILQCDTQLDSFVLALDLETGQTMWKTERDELPSWGTPNVIPGPDGPELVTNASKFIRGYDPHDGRELWRLGGSSKLTAPTPIFGEGHLVIASGRRPEMPIFVLRPGGRGDLTLASEETSSPWVVWSRQGRGSYMPTPLIYQGTLYVLGNSGILDAYELSSGKEIYRARVPHLGSGFSASPVASDNRIFLSNEDGEIIVAGTGPEFEQISTNNMGGLLMATPAISEGRMFVRSVSHLIAIGKKRN